VAGAGAKGKDQNLDAFPSQLFSLYMTYSFDLRRHLADGTVRYKPLGLFYATSSASPPLAFFDLYVVSAPRPPMMPAPH
jgi:hypothetical protein